VSQLQEPLTREDLEAKRQAFGLAREQVPGGGLPFSLDDDLKQVQVADRIGMAAEDVVRARGVPLEYVEALRQFVGQR
jgi:hypothetical protein